MYNVFDCDGVVEAIRKFPQLNDCVSNTVKTKDGTLILFTDISLTPTEIETFKDYTTEEIKALLLS